MSTAKMNGKAAREQARQASGKIFDRRLYARVFGLGAPYRGLFAWTALLAVAGAVLSPAKPYLIQVMVDEHIMQGNYDMLIRLTGIVVLLIIAEAGVKYAFSYLTARLGQSVIRDLRGRIFRHITGMNQAFFDRMPVGTLTTRTINDVEAVNEVFSEGMIAIVADLLTLLCVIAVMVYTDWRLALVSMAALPLMLGATYLFQVNVRHAFQDVRTQVARINTFLQEHISGMGIIQIFGREQVEMKNFRDINDAHRQANIRAIWHYSVFFPVVEILSAASIALMVWWGGGQAVLGNAGIQVGTLLAFILYINMLFRPMRMLADKFNTLQMGLVAAGRIFQVMDMRPPLKDEGTRNEGRFRGEVEFKKVWFAYKDDRYVLRDISFHVSPGETLAVVGATGSGKTTLVSLLNRSYDAGRGEILIDGRDIRSYTLHHLRGQVGIVLQDVFLFSGSIMDNITLGNPDITRKQVMHAAEMVGANRFIERMPGGYDFDVMERGATLSLGQRQLISFLRALIYNPSILVLDEATSSVDTESELLIRRATEELVRGRTSIIIAHRLSTIRHASRILVMDKGEVREMGTHEELLTAGGYYSRLYEMQYRDELVV